MKKYYTVSIVHVLHLCGLCHLRLRKEGKPQWFTNSVLSSQQSGATLIVEPWRPVTLGVQTPPPPPPPPPRWQRLILFTMALVSYPDPDFHRLLNSFRSIILYLHEPWTCGRTQIHAHAHTHTSDPHPNRCVLLMTLKAYIGL